MNENVKLNRMFKGALIAGVLVLVIFAFIGLAKIIPRAATTIGSAFSGITSSIFSPKETIILSLSNNSVKSNDEVNISFEHKNKTVDGIYEFKFDCSNKDLSMILIDGTNQTNLPCNTTSVINSNSFKLTPILKNDNTFVDSYLYINFYDKENNKILATGKTILTINNGTVGNTLNQTATITSNPIATTSSAINKQAVQTTQQSNIIRKSDLYIVTKDAGTVINNVFIPKTIFSSYESPSVRFDIGNDGNIPTGPWQFTAVLPTYPASVFPSGVQPSLAPGEIIEYTLSLKNLASTGNNIVSINVDPSQNVAELSETNNSAVMTLINSGVGYNYNVNTIPNYNTGYYNNSNSDLMVRTIAKGYIERYTGRFYQANSVSGNNRPAIRFEIENTGTGETGQFIFAVDFPSYTNSTYVSPVQTSFYPGEKRQFTVDFDGAMNLGTNTFTIRLDTNNNVNETRKDNNILREDISVN